MSGEQIRLQVPPKLFGVNSWIAQMIRQWIPDCWSGDRKCTEFQQCYGELVELTVDDIWQIADAGDQNFGDWHTVVDEVHDLGVENNDGLSRQACTALTEE